MRRAESSKTPEHHLPILPIRLKPHLGNEPRSAESSMCAKRATPALSSIVTTFGQPGHKFFVHFTRSILKGVSACPDTLDDSRPVVSDRLVCSPTIVVDHLLGGHQRRYHVTFLEYPSSYSSGGTSRSKSTLIRRENRRSRCSSQGPNAGLQSDAVMSEAPSQNTGRSGAFVNTSKVSMYVSY